MTGGVKIGLWVPQISFHFRESKKNFFDIENFVVALSVRFVFGKFIRSLNGDRKGEVVPSKTSCGN